MSDPTFYGEGNNPRRGDTLLRVNQKILGAIIDGGGGGGGGGTGTFSGNGSPEGVQSALQGNIYWDQVNKVFYVRDAGGLGNTGWRELIA